MYENRVAQLDQKGYQSETRKMYQAIRRAKTQYAIAEGREVKGGQMRTPEEQAKFDSQRRLSFRDLSTTEQKKLNNEIDSMWAGIPERVRGKALKLIT